MKTLVSFLAGVSLVSCATGPFYPQGPPDLSKSAMFLPQNKTEGSVFRHTSFHLGEIDGMNPGRAVRFSNGEKGIAVTPGDHRIGVAMLHGRPGTGLVTAEGTVLMKVQAGKIYEVMGSIAGAQKVDLWIRERSSRKKASPTISVQGIPAQMITIPAS
jgi:hypothetical protein